MTSGVHGDIHDDISNIYKTIHWQSLALFSVLHCGKMMHSANWGNIFTTKNVLIRKPLPLIIICSMVKPNTLYVSMIVCTYCIYLSLYIYICVHINLQIPLFPIKSSFVSSNLDINYAELCPSTWRLWLVSECEFIVCSHRLPRCPAVLIWLREIIADPLSVCPAATGQQKVMLLCAFWMDDGACEIYLSKTGES